MKKCACSLAYLMSMLGSTKHSSVAPRFPQSSVSQEFEEAVLIQRERLRLWRAYSKEIAIPSLR